MTQSTLAYFIVFFLALVLTVLLIPLVIAISHRFKILDHPSDRKLHAKPTPCTGGLAIYTVFNAVVIGSIVAIYACKNSTFAQYWFPSLLSQLPLIRNVWHELLCLLAGATVILIIGLIDDRIGAQFDYRIKLLVQVATALLLSIYGIRVDFMESDILNIAVTTVWIVGLTNAFNLLDNMDGLSGGVAWICSLLFFFVAMRQGQFFVALLFLTLAGSLLGFLFFNFHPAKIFLGDSGALFIGFLLSTASVIQTYITPESKDLLAVLMPILILSVPIFDTTRVIVIRLYEKRPIFQGDRRHISHRLVEMGMSPKSAVLSIYLLTLALGLGSTVLDLNDPFSNCMILFQVLAFILVVTCLLGLTRKAKAR